MTADVIETVDVETEWGVFTLYAGDHITTVMQEAHYERAIIARIDELMGPDRRICIDVGAHVGTHAVPFSQMFERVYAVEPNPVALDLLYKNLDQNDCWNAYVIESALSDRLGRTECDTPDPGNIGHTGIYAVGQIGPVVATTLDSLNLQGVSLIKIDTEGCEPAVIRGARLTIIRDKPCILFENNRTHAHRDALWWLLNEVGYSRLYRMSKNLFVMP